METKALELLKGNDEEVFTLSKTDYKITDRELPPCPSCKGNEVYLQFGTYEAEIGGSSWAGIHCAAKGCEAELCISGETEAGATEKAIGVWRGKESKAESSPTKTSQQLYEEFSILTNDTQRWQWILANQGGDFAIYLDSDCTRVTFEGAGEYDGFDEYIGRGDGIKTLLDAMGIKREVL